MLEDLTDSGYSAGGEDVHQELHRLRCALGLRDLANNYYPYWSTGDRAKQVEVFQLPAFSKFASEHKYIVTLPERRGVLEARVTTECDFDVHFPCPLERCWISLGGVFVHQEVG